LKTLLTFIAVLFVGKQKLLGTNKMKKLIFSAIVCAFGFGCASTQTDRTNNNVIDDQVDSLDDKLNKIENRLKK